MANQPYLVVRLIPSEPVDGGTFATYLDTLELQAFDSGTLRPLSVPVFSSPLSLFQWPPGEDPNINGVSTATTVATPYDSSAKNYGETLSFNSVQGISIGAFVWSTDDQGSSPTIPAGDNLAVMAVNGTTTPQTVTLNNPLPNYVPTGTPVSFTNRYTGENPASPSTSPSFSLATNGAATTVDGGPLSSENPLVVLPFASTTGVVAGMAVGPGPDIATGTTVVEVTATTVIVYPPLLGSPTTGTMVTFTLKPPFAALPLTPTSSTSTQLTFSSGNKAAGVAVGMTLSPEPGIIAPGTTVTEATETTVTLSQALLGALPANQAVIFTFPLSSGIAQHYIAYPNIIFAGLSISVVVAPAAVATAIIPLNLPSPNPDYLNIDIVASRNSEKEVIPVNNPYYNVLASNGDLPPPYLYQTISSSDTSLYITLPPQPGTAAISLTIPSDGSPPPFDALYKAMQTALENDPFLDTLTSNTIPPLMATTTADCPSQTSTLTFAAADVSRISSELPARGAVGGLFVSGPPNIPSGTTVLSAGATTVTISNPVSGDVPSDSVVTFTPGATLIASLIASPADCTRMAYDIIWSNLNPLPGPPDPLEQLYTNPPNTGGSSTSGGSSGSNPPVLEQDRQKFQGTLNSFYSTRNANAERLTKFVAAVSAAVYCEQTSLYSSAALLEFPVDPTANFASAVESELLLDGLGLAGTSNINFGVPAAFFYVLGAQLDKSTSVAQRYQMATGDAIDRLLQAFAAAANAEVIEDTEGFADPRYNTVQISTFQAARRLVALGVSGASTSPAATVVAGSDLASLISDWLSATDPAVTSPPSPAPNPPQTYQNKDFNIWTQRLAIKDPQGYLKLDLDALTQGFVIPEFTANTSGNTTAGSTTLTVIINHASGSIGVGMPVSGTNIPSGITVKAVTTATTGNVTTATVTLSTAVSGNVPANTPITFNFTIPPFTATTTTDCPTGMTLTFAGADGAKGISNGMLVSGTNIAYSTTVQSVAATTVKLKPAVLGDVPNASIITFVTPVPPNTIPSTLADQIELWLGSITANPTVVTLIAVTAAQWTSFFSANPTWLPPFTQPVAPGASGGTSPTSGYIATRIRAFIRAVQKFFTVSSVPTTAQLPAPGAPPAFEVPAFDPFSGLPGGFNFEHSLTSAQLSAAISAAISSAFPSGEDPAAQAWLSQAITTIYELSQIASAVPNPAITGFTLPNPVSLSFSVMEALYARGFTSARQIVDLSGNDFQESLAGTVAYDFASSLYQTAQKLAAAPPSATQAGESFQPINPNGTLANCVPSWCISPLGPTAYLQELLKLSEASTCKNPFATPASGHITLGAAVTARRGPIGSLMASGANLETPLPLIDIVNECLEYLGAATSPAGGTIYDTSADQVAGHALCQEPDRSPEHGHRCHDPAAMFAALPEYSTPATPVSQNQSVEPLVYNKLRSDFSSCDLPYSQALDVSRTYLRHLGTSRFEETRTFRKCITEFVLDPTNSPTGFQSYLWRYPVRIETAIEYLGVTPEEYTMLFQGTPPQPCAQAQVDSIRQAAGTFATSELYGFPAAGDDDSWTEKVIVLPEFLCRTCLTYCEFLELWNSVVAPMRGGNYDASTTFPDCEPCCLQDYRLPLPEGDQGEQILYQLALFIRLWRKLAQNCSAGYSFAELWDICTVFDFFNGATVNPEFIRQLAAFQMLRDRFDLPLVDHADETSGATGADRTHLLALWVGSSAKKWHWAVDRLLKGVEAHATLRFGCEHRRDEGIAHMAGHLDALSRLAGFNPPTATTPSTDTWNSHPTCTLRFAEVLAKMRASRFRVEELLHLFNGEYAGADDLGALQEPEDALSYPLDLGEPDDHHSLWRLRETLLAVEVGEEEAIGWTWPRIVSEMRGRFGYAPPSGQDPLLSIGQHFFPDVLEASGYSVGGKQRQYRTALTSSAAWSSPPGSSFQYDAGSNELWVQPPLRDEAVAAKLSHLPELTTAEQVAVQDLYFAPRADLASFAFLFPDWQSAEIHLIEEREETRRWSYFRHHFALADARRRVIVEHLARHVAHRTGCRHDHLEGVAGLVLSYLFSDENTGTPWESDSGAPPTVMWTPPAGGAIAALLGLIGTGLLGEYEIAQPQSQPLPANAPGAAEVAYQVVWRDVRGPLTAFGHERDVTNSPVPTVLPALGLTLAADPLITLHNGYAVQSSDGRRLGGAEAFRVRWSGALLIHHEGEYAFHAGAPTPDGERPNVTRAEKSQWRVTLKRGPRIAVILNHEWPGETGYERPALRLSRGAYHITVEYAQPAPDFTVGSHLHPQQTGFQVKYAGPDSDGLLVTLPLRHLYRDFQDHTLDQGIHFLDGSKNAQAFLKAFYTSTLRDIRRTYKRAFKAVLFCGRFELSARPAAESGQSELGYMLANPQQFAGYAYYRTSSTTFATHLACFDFNFLPVQDGFPPAPVPPDRSQPSLQRTQAMFDWWERVLDYDLVRKEIHHRCKGQLWLLFYEALAKQPTDVAQLLRHIGASPQYWNLDLRFYQDQNSSIYSVTSTDLEDERWLVRVWHADRLVRDLLSRFDSQAVATARPDLWAALDPSAPVPGSGSSETGNANLSEFLADGCLESGEPRRYEEFKRLNDGLRERGRNALVSYLCAMNRVALPWTPTGTFARAPRDLSDLLLLDVEAGICEKASRIDEAITAVQSFVRRIRLGLEQDWKVGREFARMWDSRFDTYRTWERCKRQELYRENWIEWDELGKARRTAAFCFLESQLRSSTLTLAAPGGLDWWADENEPLEFAPKLLQRRSPSELHPLSPPPQSTTREGLGTLGGPEYAASPTWLARVPLTTTAATSSPPAPSNPSPLGAATASMSASPPAGTQRQPLPLWMEAAIKMGTHFLRVAAAAIPQAALEFVSHRDEPESVCCQHCDHEHPIFMDEYYFWLVRTNFYAYNDDTDSQTNTNTGASFQGSYQFGFQDSYYDQFQQQSAEWNDEDQVPQLLAKWQPNPAVRLAWCRVHNGEFGQPRKSDEYVPVGGSPNPADLVFLGRSADSLYFSVSGYASPEPPPGYSDTSPPGFRYDLPSDRAVALPQVLEPPKPATPSPYPGGLLSYPFFAYHEPGASLFPRSWFSPSLLVGDALRAHCRFELALKWYARAFNPLKRDCTWMVCPEGATGATGATTGTTGATGATIFTVGVQGSATGPAGGTGTAPSQSACCDSTKVTDDVARNRAMTLNCCQTMLEWADSLMRHRNSPEAFQQARLICDMVAKVMGPRPPTVLLQQPTTAQPVSSFVPGFAPLNPRLLDLYDLVADRTGLIHACLDARRLRNGRPNRDMPYFGDNPLREGWRTVVDSCADETEWCHRASPYRFVFLIQKATEYAGRVRELGSALLSAYEKGDAEYLASLRAGQERELLALGLPIRQDQWRDADWQVQALQQTKDVNQTNLLYYNNLFQNGLINDEIQNLDLAINAMQTRTNANITEAYGEALKVIPDIFVGFCSSDSQVPAGTKLAGVFETIAKVIQTVADIQSETAAIDLTQANWQRRSDEWFHQTLTLPIEIQQIELQLLGAQRRRDQALQELNNQQRQTEHASEVEDFLRDKFTATDLYLWLQKETAALYSRMYELALYSARQAECAFNFERGHTTRRFIPEECWDSLHEGLMAGERLEFALHRMEKAYLDENVREYELTKHFSLRLQFPIAYVQLRTAGYCEIDIPEWMFDLDYPGHYMRRIKNVTLTIPCVTGPYTGVHCRLTLLSSTTRIDPRVTPPSRECCSHGMDRDACQLCGGELHIVRQYGAREAIATSSGQNDSGLLELNFHDERYLPFEFLGAVSRWRIELPPENNYFDLDTVTDLVLNLNYTAREGGEMLRREAFECARRHLPDDGWCFFDLRHDFPDAWQLFRDQSGHDCEDRARGRRLELRLRREMFPFIPGDPNIGVRGLGLLFETRERHPCNSHIVSYRPSRMDGDGDDRNAQHIKCVPLDIERPNFYCGFLAMSQLEDLNRGGLQRYLVLRFPEECGEIVRAFLLCRYDVVGSGVERVIGPVRPAPSRLVSSDAQMASAW